MPKILEPILTPQDAAWGHQVNDRLLASEQTQGRAAQERTATNKGVAASLDSLSRQISDLAGRISYTVTDVALNVSWVATEPPGPWGPTLTFVLTDTRTVSLDFRTSIAESAVSYNSSTRATVSCQMVVVVDGVVVSPAPTELYAIAEPGTTSGGASAYQQATISARAVVTLGPGTHVVQGGFSLRGMTLTGSPAAGSVMLRAYAPSIFVDVLQIVR